jgi:hypothetical protein
VSSRYLVGGSVLSWARSKLEGKIAQKREDVEYERARGTPEGLADELETLAELEQDLRAATPAPEGAAIIVEDGCLVLHDKSEEFQAGAVHALAKHAVTVQEKVMDRLVPENEGLQADLLAERKKAQHLDDLLGLATRGLREQTLAKFAVEEERDRLTAETDRFKRDVAYYERELKKVREIVDHLDCIDRDADEAGIHRDFVERWRRGGE